MFLKSNLRVRKINSVAIYLALFSFISVITYILVSQIYFRIGFPLDDSWIHQTYARNLANSGEWAFIPGEVSGGSTSPLWTALLSAGYLIRIPFYIWTFGLGILLLWGVAYLVEMTVRTQVDSYRPAIPWIGLLIIFEWHFTWAAASGMETLLFSAVVLWVLLSLIEKNPNYIKIGILIGISIWIRPDGLTLIGPALMVSLVNNHPLKRKLIDIEKIVVGFGVIFSLYILFSLAVAGTPWPTTFYAKQVEYEILSNKLYLDRLGELSVQLLIGIGSVLLPGYLLQLTNTIRKRKWASLAIFLWVFGFLILYAWRLPVVYQHGRYVIPVILVYIALSCIGMMDYIERSSQGIRWMLEKAWIIGISVLLIIFWGYGSVIYSQDVAIINSEMVDSAIWIERNIHGDAIIAAHDIGALGYFGNHKIIDLAGLISPQVIPFLRDEDHLVEFLDSQNVDYLITFPGWYPKLSSGLLEIYTTQGNFAPRFGGENMVVYQWKN